MTLSTIIEDFNQSLYGISEVQMEHFAKYVLKALKNKGKVFICGNGGSGANANLFAAAMSSIAGNPCPMGVISLNSNMAVITQLAECFGYNKVFSQQIRNLAEACDLLIAISGSGNSPNILEAVSTAKGLGMDTIGLTGMGGGKLSSLVDFPIVVNSDSMELIETVHTVILHAISGWVAEMVAD